MSGSDERKGTLIFDFGTSKVRGMFICFADGSVPVSGKTVYPVLECPTELDPADLWACAQDLAEDIVPECIACGFEIEAVSFSFFGANIIALDENHEPVYPLIVSYDQRAVKQSAEIREIVGPQVAAKVLRGGLNGMDVPSKILWLKEEKPEIFAKAAHFQTIQQYILGKLGYPNVWERTLAASAQCYDVENDEWMHTLLAACGLPGFAPETVDTDTVLGRIDSFGRVKLPKPAVLLAGGHDCVICQLGQGEFPFGNNLLTNIAGTYDLIGFFHRGYVNREGIDCLTAPYIGNFCVFAGGPSGDALNRFVARVYGPDAPDIGMLLRTAVFDGTRTLRFSSTDPDGIPEEVLQSAPKDELFAAFIEAITLNLRKCFQRMCRLNGEPFSQMRIGGGASASDAWLQLRADIFGIPIVRCKNPESSSAGAAALAAKASGYYPTIEQAVESMCQPADTFFPDPVISRRYADWD